MSEFIKLGEVSVLRKNIEQVYHDEDSTCITVYTKHYYTVKHKLGRVVFCGEKEQIDKIFDDIIGKK